MELIDFLGEEAKVYYPLHKVKPILLLLVLLNCLDLIAAGRMQTFRPCKAFLMYFIFDQSQNVVWHDPFDYLKAIFEQQVMLVLIVSGQELLLNFDVLLLLRRRFICVSTQSRRLETAGSRKNLEVIAHFKVDGRLGVDVDPNFRLIGRVIARLCLLLQVCPKEETRVVFNLQVRRSCEGLICLGEHVCTLGNRTLRIVSVVLFDWKFLV